MAEEMRFEVPMDELRQFMQKAASALSSMAANYRPIGPFVTVDDRLKDRWPMATKKDRCRVRDVCVGMFMERLGRRPYKMNGCPNGTFMIEQDHLPILDRAIDVVRAEVEARGPGPLFGERDR